MNKILACTDGSLYAPSVYHHTAWAAHRCAASVHVVHMLKISQARGASLPLGGSMVHEDGLQAELATFEEIRNRMDVERGQAQLAEAERQLRVAGVGEIAVELQYGAVADAVSRLEPGCGLVVMGKRGETADFTCQHLGANLERVIRSSIRPVLVASRKFAPIESFLLAWDGGPSVHNALRYAMEEPLLRGLRCHLVQAGHVASEAMRDRAVDRLRASGFEVTVEVTPGEPEQVIGDAVQREGIDLLVMGAYGHSRLRSIVVGSTTAAMVLSRQVPVLMFRQQTEIRASADEGQSAADPQFV